MNIKFIDMDIVLLGTSQWYTSLFPTVVNNNMAEERTCEMGSTLAPPV